MVYVFTVTRADSDERARMLASTLMVGREKAGCDFTWGVWCVEESRAIEAVGSLPANTIQEMHLCAENCGQHVAWNQAIKRARELGARYFVRVDDDVEWLSNDWLAKLVEASQAFGDKFVISPEVWGLIQKPPCSDPCEVSGHIVEFLTEAIGGIVRLHPMCAIDDPERPFIADVRKPCGSGDATGMGTWCKRSLVPMVYLKGLIVKHGKGTLQQMLEDPTHFSEHDIWQHIPYMPAWRPHA